MPPRCRRSLALALAGALAAGCAAVTNPVTGRTEFTTSLFPKDGLYLVPLKAAVRKKEKLEEGDKVTIKLEIR